MLDARNLFSEVIEKIEAKEDEYIEKLDNLEIDKSEEEYIHKLEDKKVNDIYALLTYYENLKCNTEIIKFQDFVLSIIQEKNQTEELLEELKNLHLLKKTELLKYAKEQESHSKRIIGNFLLKLTSVKERLKSEKNIATQIEEMDEKLRIIKKYKTYFTPIGIVKEVKDPEEFNAFVKELNLSDNDYHKILVMSFEFNRAFHDTILKNYTTPIYKEKEIKRKIMIERDTLSKIKKYLKENDIDEVLHHNKETKQIEKKSLNFQFIDYDYETANALYETANENLKNNHKKDPYKSFIDYYETLLGEKKDVKDENIEVIKTAKSYLDNHKNLLDNLTEVEKQDLDNTLRVYQQDESLREEVYKTTENIERLIVYEINYIFEKFDKKKNDNIVELANQLNPAISYISTTLKNNHKK